MNRSSPNMGITATSAVAQGPVQRQEAEEEAEADAASADAGARGGRGPREASVNPSGKAGAGKQAPVSVPQRLHAALQAAQETAGESFEEGAAASGVAGAGGGGAAQANAPTDAKITHFQAAFGMSVASSVGAGGAIGKAGAPRGKGAQPQPAPQLEFSPPLELWEQVRTFKRKGKGAPWKIPAGCRANLDEWKHWHNNDPARKVR